MRAFRSDEARAHARPVTPAPSMNIFFSEYEELVLT
jgi:hypothetical protein